MTDYNYIIAIEFEGKLISYDYYLILNHRKYDPTRRVCIIGSEYCYGALSFDQEHEIIGNLHSWLYGKAYGPDGFKYQWVRLSDYVDDYGYEARIWDIAMGHI